MFDPYDAKFQFVIRDSCVKALEERMNISQSTRHFNLEVFYFPNYMPESRADHYGSQALLVGRFIYVTGNLLAQVYDSSEAAVIVIDSISGHVRCVEAENGPRTSYHACILWGESLYLYGGNPGNELVRNRMWRYDLALEEFVTVDEFGAKPLRHSHYIVGGLVETKSQFLIATTSSSTKIKLKAVEVRLFDLPSQLWTVPDVAGKRPSCRLAAASCMVNGRFYLAGGWSGAFVFDDMYILDCRRTLHWSEITFGREKPRTRLATLTRIPSTTFLVLGGGVGQRFSDPEYKKLRIFDMATSEWHVVEERRTPVIPLEETHTFTVDGIQNVTLYGHSAVATNNGILFLGGTSGKALLLKEL